MAKITIFINNIYTAGGVEKVVSLIANEFCKFHDVEIVSLYKTNDTTFFKIDERVQVKNILTNRIYDPRKYIFYLLYKVNKYLKTNNTDVFIAAGMYNVPLTLGAKRNAKYIAWEHGNSYAINEGRIPNLGRKLAAKYADKIVVLTQDDMEHNIKLFKTQNKIVQIYNPVEMVTLSNMYNANSKKIITVGQLLPVKGHDMLINVAKKVFAMHPDWEWHIYGDGPEKEKLQKLIAENGIEKNLLLKGKVNNLHELYKEYALFVLTSRSEGFPMVNIEAHNAKLPIISFDCSCGPREVIKEGVNGYLIDCFDIDEMAAKINYLIENDSVRIEMSERTSFDKEKLQMSNVIKEWEKILKENLYDT